MGPTIIARNYAETLFELAEKHGGAAAVEEYGRALDGLAELVRREPRIRRFLETPMVDVEAKKGALRSALGGRVPELFLRFVFVVVEKRRQGLLRTIAAEYQDLLDRSLGRVRAEVTLAEEPDAEMQAEITRMLEQRVGGAVIPSFRVDPTLMGGVLIRVGDQVLDGSIRRRLTQMRRRMLQAELPHAAAV